MPLACATEGIHSKESTLVLYDVSSSYMEGRCCPLAKRGHSRDGKKGTLQITYGLLCAADGCPVAIEVFEGNIGDPRTLAKQVEELKHRFKLDHVVIAGDRGMITQARINTDIRTPGLDWITALRAPTIQAPCRFHCSTNVIWPASRRRNLLVSAWSYAAILNSLPNELARARICWLQPIHGFKLA